MASIASHDALAAEAHRRLPDQLGTRHGGRVQGHLVRPGSQKRPHVFQTAESAAHGQRQVHGFGRAPDDVQHRGTALMRRRDVQEHELVGALSVVGNRGLDRVARVGEVQEPHALDDPAILDVKAGNHAAGQHRRQAATAAFAARRSTAPV